MKTISGKILQMLGWKIIGEFPDLKKSITIFTPHTAPIDAIHGKLGFTELGVNYLFLSKKKLFFFPMNIIMRKFGSMAVRGVEGKKAIYQVVDIFYNPDELHVVVPPEGWVNKFTEWNNGFYYVALKANIPIVVTYLDYKKKELGVKGVIYDTESYNSVIKQIYIMYKDVTGKNPERFALETID